MEHRTAALRRKGEAAAREGRKAEARRAFCNLLNNDPDSLPALLWLTWLSEDPRSSLAYAEQAVGIDPENQHALAAREWARSRLASSASSRPASQRSESRQPTRGWRRLMPLIAIGSLIAFIAGTLLVILWYAPDDMPVIAALAVTPCPTPTSTPSPTTTMADKPTPTPTPTVTATPTKTLTRTPTQTPTPTTTPSSTPTPTPSASLTPSATAPPTPSATPRPTDPPPSPTPDDLSPARSSVQGNVRWIDIDLGRQTLTAYAGQTPVRSTLVSTGLPGTATPVGRFHIYVKYRYDDMSGPGYYLPDVPYTMYFHRGYGIHGTYWHSNFGHPMSHGCINLPTAEAQWLFDWASVGTLVNIHW